MNEVEEMKERVVQLSIEFWAAPHLSEQEQDLFREWMFAVKDLNKLIAEEIVAQEMNAEESKTALRVA